MKDCASDEYDPDEDDLWHILNELVQRFGVDKVRDWLDTVK